MDNEPAHLSVLFIGPDDDRFARLEETISEYYRCTLGRVRREYSLKDAYEDREPDFVVLDTEMNDLMESLSNYDLMIPEMKKVPLVLLVDSPDNPDHVSIPLTVAGYLTPDGSEPQILKIMDRMARMAGYSLETGKLEDRLVRRQLSLEFQTSSGNTFARGKTTGMDFEGLHARVNTTIDGIDPLELEGIPCKVRFLDPDLLELQVHSGTIEQVGDGWEPGFEFFVSYTFDPDDPAGFQNDEMAGDILSTLIENQRELSVRKKELKSSL